MPRSILKNAADFDGGHRWLAEELLQPLSNNCDAGRTTMFCSHITQAVVLDAPEPPRVFSRFENHFGSYTTAVRRLPAAARVIGVFDRNPLQRVFALEYDDGTAAIHFAAPVRHLTETYGYRLDNSHLAGVGVGDVLPAGAQLQGWSCADADGNFGYGVNLRTLYLNRDGQTYEDAFIISESGARRLAHTSVTQLTVVMNANDLPVNLYGGEEEGDYRGFPAVGEVVRGGILLARRRINHESALFDLSTPQLCRVNSDSDTVVYAEGTVVDIEVFTNLTEAELDKHPYHRQTLDLQRQWVAFQDWVLAVLGPYVQGGKYSEDVAHWVRRCRGTREGKWRHDKTEFDGTVLKFTIAKYNTLKEGGKITNRYGGKGVEAVVLPDAEMPVSEDGRRADLVVNSLGVLNRLNLSCLYEHELNFIAEEVQLRMVDLAGAGDWGGAWEVHRHFLSIVSPPQAEWLEADLPPGSDARAAYLREVCSGEEPIYVHQPPVFGNCGLDDLARAYTELGIRRVRIVGIEEPQILGWNYFLKLRHDAEGKFSARSAKHLSVSGVPTKNSRGMKLGTEHHSTTPIRLGEQEIENLLIANNPEELKRFLRLVATDDVSREGVIEELLTRRDAFSRARLVPRGSGTTRPVAGLLALLESIGLTLDATPNPAPAPTDPEGEPPDDE